MSYTYSTLKVGDSQSFSKTITAADILLFAAVSGDMNQLHINDEYAKTTFFGQRIAHGALTSSLIPAALTLAFPGSVYISQYVEFVAPVFINDTITVKAICTEKLEKRNVKMQTNCYNQRDECVLRGEAVTKLAKEPAPEQGN